MLDGLDKLCLNNLIQDNTMMKDYIAYTLMNDFGADSPLCSFAYITVNGEDWGLYLAVESIEDSFLSRNYGSEAGELYKPDSMSFGGGRGNGKDFKMDDFDFSGSDDEEKESGRQSEKQSDTGSKSDKSNNSSGKGGFSFGGQTPPGGMEMPEGMSPPDGMEMPGGMTPPEGFDGQFPGFPGNDSRQGGFPGGNFPGFSGDGNFPSDFSPADAGNTGTASDAGAPEIPGDAPAATPSDSGENKKSGRGGFGGGMGSDDVKLKYIDDDPDSYSNIFDNAKTDINKSDKKRLIKSLEKLSSYTDLEEVLDMDEVLRYFVVHNYVCNGDSYTGMMIHNYYLHESDGKLSMIPWDYNLAFGTFQGGNASGTVNTSIDSPISMGNSDDRPMLGWIFSDENYTRMYHELFSEFIEKWFTDGELEKLITDTADMIRPYVEKDPTKFCTSEDFEKGVDTLTRFVSLRGEAVSRQLSGDTAAVETGDLNLSDMGSMGGGMGKGQGGFSGSFNIMSMVTLKDADGKEIAISDIIDDTSSIETVTLSDGTEINLSSADMRKLMKTDLSKIVSVTDKEGNETDLSAYTVSFSIPSDMGGGRSRDSGSFPSRNGMNQRGGSDDSNAGEAGEKEKPARDDKTPGREKDENTAGSQEKSEESGRFPGNGGNFTPPDGFPGGSSGSSGSESTFWILTAVSAAALALGLIIAIRKKY
jgi:spore coat protein CotH